MKWVIVLVWSSVAVFPFRLTAAQSQLDAVRAAVRTPTPDSNDDSRHSHDHDPCYSHDHHDGWEDAAGEVFGPIIAIGLTAPWWGPHAILGDSLDRPAVPAHYPECWYDVPGGSSRAGNYGRRWFGNVWLEYGNDFDNLERIAGAVRLETKSRWGFDTAWASYQEIENVAANDNLMTGDLNVTYRFAQSERIHLRSGLGMNWLDDAGHTDIGFNFTYGGDVFLWNPWVLSTEIDWGTLHHAERFHGRTTLGVVWQHVEAYAGFDYESFDAASLKSVVFGIRYWY